MKLQIGGQPVDLRPFLGAALVWAAIAVASLFALSADPIAGIRTFALYFVLAVTDLFFLVKTVAATLVLMSDQGAKNRAAYVIQAAVFGGLKILCLGTIGLCLWKFPGMASSGILFGLGALIFVPLAGGFLWSQSELKKAEDPANKG